MTKYFNLRRAGWDWGTGYRAKSPRDAVKQFVLDPVYGWADGRIDVEVYGVKHLFRVVKKTEVIKKITVKFSRI